MAKNIDMTTGSPFKKIFLFALPVAIGYVLQNFYSLGDSIIVSLARGENAVTGINITSSLIFLVNGFAQGMSAGFGIVLSQFVGAKNQDKMRQSIATSLLLTFFISVLLSISFFLLAPTILKVLNTNELFYDYALSYIRIIFAGILFMGIYNLADQILRALGDSKSPLIILIICSTLNLILNSLLFITDLSVAWAGWATIISQAISAGVGFIIIFKKFKELKLKKSDFKIDFNFIFRHLATGLPMAFQFTITAVSCMIQQKAFNSLPNPDFAKAQGTGSKLDNLFSAALFGASNAMAIYCGQNYGANKLDRIKSGVKCSYLVGLIFTAFCFILNLLLCKPLSKILLYGVTNDILKLIFQYTFIQSLFYYSLYVLLSLRQSLQGMGYSSLTLVGGTIELIMRCLAAFVLANLFGYNGACFSNVLAWVGGMITFMICYYAVIKKLQTKAMNGNIFIE
ncbi:MAG: polysaccharide biosynthesis C-terminal domain-containing protein [Clostridia bacterium]|nr:polysaccharide biosynthesis C-terminal domain-containing protein [Clostridia bacterium]